MNNKHQFQFHQPFYSEELQESRRGVSMPRKKNTFNVLMFIMILVTKEDNYLREVKEVYCFNVVQCCKTLYSRNTSRTWLFIL